MNTRYTQQFFQQYKHLSDDVKKKAQKKERIFQRNPFDSRLKTHKLKGRLDEFWAFSIDFKHRIIFAFEGKNLAVFHAIGGHSIYF